MFYWDYKTGKREQIKCKRLNPTDGGPLTLTGILQHVQPVQIDLSVIKTAEQGGKSRETQLVTNQGGKHTEL